MNANESYIFGILISDGSLYLDTRNRGKVSLELNIRDSDIIYKLFKEIPNCNKIRFRNRTNKFKENFKTIILSNSRLEFRDFLITNGFPIKDKSIICNVPNKEYSVFDFWRGVLDGDGSIGFTNNGIPFISLVTKSVFLKDAFLEFLFKEYNIIKRINPNKRDSVFNITVTREDALKLAYDLYLSTENSLYLDRKFEKAKEIQSWKRKVPKINRKIWTPIEDNFILSHSMEDSMKELHRTENSIKMRLYRLKS